MEAPNFILYEHSTGYALFRIDGFEDIGKLLPQVEWRSIEKGKFLSQVKLASFFPFRSAANALENCNSVSEGVLHVDLTNFLETNLPKQKKSKTVLGVGDSRIGQSIVETFAYLKCVHVGPVQELLRGIRLYFSSLAQTLSENDEAKAQLGLGHSYSRAKVKFNVHRVDNMIIQAIALLDQLDKDINTFSMRIREWYSYHFPELYKIVPDQYTYCRCARFIKDRKNLSPDHTDDLKEIVVDEEKTNEIFEAARSSMGMDISPIDLMNIERFTDRVVSLTDYRRELQEYLKARMHSCAPNLAVLIGEQVGARLISKAGSLTNLAKYPASTIQILGAEKALFRALKTRGATPKYGLLFHSTFIGRAAAKNKGRISRYLANKCAIASRIDCFSDIPVEAFGQHLKQQVEDRLKFFESGEFPKKNVEVMKEAMVDAVAQEAKILKKRKKLLKKEKKMNGECAEIETQLHVKQELIAESQAIEQELENEEKVLKKRKKMLKKEKKMNGECADAEIETQKVHVKQESIVDSPAIESENEKKRKKMLKKEKKAKRMKTESAEDEMET